jgi:hypothetical protein
MNHKFVPAIAAFLILGMLLSLSLIPLTYAQTYAIGPQLTVVTIPQDNQELGTGVVILGLGTAPYGTLTDLMSQYKLEILYNGAPLTWLDSTPGPSYVCSVYEKDKINVVNDPKTGLGKQAAWENLMTSLVDVSNNFVCKFRWTYVTTSMLESIGVMDVYYVGPTATTALAPLTTSDAAYFIADNIVNVDAYITVGRTVVWGSDIQDLCVLGWVPNGYLEDGAAMTSPRPDIQYTKPDGALINLWSNPMGHYVSCEGLALIQRDLLKIPLATGQDPGSEIPT